jgi:hypothetical protein
MPATGRVCFRVLPAQCHSECHSPRAPRVLANACQAERPLAFGHMGDVDRDREGRNVSFKGLRIGIEFDRQSIVNSYWPISIQERSKL